METRNISKSRSEILPSSNLLPHLILPKRLPSHPLGAEVEDGFIILTLNSLKQLNALDRKSAEYFNEIIEIFDNWSSYQNSGSIDAKLLNFMFMKKSESIKIPIYIRSQNAALIVESANCQCESELVLSSFIASQKSEEVMSTNDILIAAYPGTSISIPRTDFLNSLVFTELIEYLSTVPQENAMPKTVKARNEFSDDREPPDPFYITQWLPAILAHADSKVCPHYVRVVKKINDEVQITSNIPFRRSGMWTSVKVILQLHFVKKFGQTEGLVLYKLTILQILCYGIHIWKAGESAEYKLETIQKITRKLLKLEEYVNSHLEKLPNELIEFIKSVSKSAEEITIKIQRSLHLDWKKIVSDCRESSKIADLECKEDFLTHDLGNIKKFLKIIFDRERISSNQFVPKNTIHDKTLYNDCSRLFPLSKLSNNSYSYYSGKTSQESDNNTLLHDFENFVKFNIENFSITEHSKDLMELFEKYLNIAQSHYEDDPIGKSYMILTLLKILKVMDQSTCNKYPLLLHYEPSINPEQFILDLLLPQLVDLGIAKSLETYFKTRREKATYPSLLSENSVSKYSFGVVYAKSNHEMQLLKETILKDQEVSIENKKKEILAAKKEIQKLREEINSLPCETMVNIKGRTVHSGGCEKHRLKSKADKYTVNVLEEFLPTNEDYRDAIMFELLIPVEISYLRDTLLSFHKNILKSFRTGSGSGSQGHALWVDYSRISQHAKKTQRRLTLGSTTQLVESSHFKNHSPEYLNPEDFIVHNGYNVQPMLKNDKYSSSSRVFSGLKSPESIKHQCTFQVLTNSNYEQFQNYIDSTNHSVNLVYASQDICPHELPLAEYREFGSLRSGIYLQWHNIYRALSQSSLSFEEPSVVNLLLQTIWEAGELEANDNCIREPAITLLDDLFVKAMIDLLDKKVDENEKNWKASNLLICIILIASKINSITKNIEINHESARILRKSRMVALNWIQDIKTLTLNTSSGITTSYRNFLFSSGIVVCLSFFVEIKNLESILNVSDWIRGIVTINDNKVSDSSVSINVYRRNLLRLVTRVAVNVCKYLDGADSKVQKGLDKFLMNFWKTDEPVGTWIKDIQSEVFRTQVEDKLIEVDLISGVFEINGNPQGRLPTSIEGQDEFKRLFGIQKFEVSRAPPSSSYFSNTFQTVGEFDGCKYAFATFVTKSRNTYPVFTERDTESNSGKEYILIPHSMFNGILPFMLIHKYSHWYCKSTSIIELRDKKFSVTGFRKTVKYIIDLQTNQVKSVINNSLLIVNCKSTICQQISKILSRLEDPKFLIMEYDPNSFTIKSILMRMGLNFYTNLNSNPMEIISHEFTDMKVAKEQTQYGTLIGLQNGLLLTDQKQRNKKMISPILLVPYSNKIKMTINSSSSSNSKPNPNMTHRRIYIEIPKDTSNSAMYFTYEVDYRLRRLKAGQSQEAWLFLAQLHALSSSVLPDPLTGTTGSESAIRLLQSAHCWSDRPYSTVGVEILTSILVLSPKREYFPEKMKIMQKVRFSNGFDSYSFNDAYSFIIDKLLLDSQRNPFQKEQKVEKVCVWKRTNKELAIRAYQSHNLGINEDNHVSKYFMPMELLRNRRNLSSYKYISAVCLAESQLIRQISQCYHNKHSSFEALSNSQYFLRSEFGSLDRLNGCSNLTGKAAFQDLRYEVPKIARDFKNWWITIYNAAINARSEEQKHSFIVFLQLLTQYCGKIDKQYIKMFLIILQNQEKFQDCIVPSQTSFESTNEIYYDKSKIELIIESQTVRFSSYFEKVKEPGFYEMDYEEREKIRKEKESGFKILKIKEVSTLEKVIRGCWDKDDILDLKNYNYNSLIFESDTSVYFGFSRSVSQSQLILKKTEAIFTKWRNNIELRAFLIEVGVVIENLQGINITDINHFVEPHSQREVIDRFSLQKTDNGFEIDKLILNYQLKTEREIEAREIFETGQIDTKGKDNSMEIDSKMEKQIPSRLAQEFPFNFGNNINCKIENDFLKLFKDSWDQHQQDLLIPPAIYEFKNNTIADLSTKLLFAWSELIQILQKSAEFDRHILLVSRKNQLMDSGLFPRLTPMSFIPKLLEPTLRGSSITDIIGEIVVLWVYEQYFFRIEKFRQNQSTLLLQKEIENPPHLNWSPKYKPEWLILELEMDISVRQVQCEVANRMINPENAGNTVMQLNMGEGKTSVILPLCIASLANGEQLCRVVVLNPLFQMNFNSLRNVLSGLLNKRVYSFPCSRDLIIDSVKAKKMLHLYEECQEKKGVFLTIPEHRLSFMLKVIEMCRSSISNGITEMIEVLNYLTANARDILDESDEICNVKYQLVYTLGKQQRIEEIRHKVAQGILKILPKHLSNIAREDYNMAEASNRTENEIQNLYPNCRIFNEQCYEKLCSLIADDILNGNPNVKFSCKFSLTENRILKRFLVDKNADEATHEAALGLVNDSLNDKNILLMLRGLLAKGILLTCLLKRYRVNYGVNKSSRKILMAVPFKANDVAAENTEFGHADVAIIFTQLSYYYSGLNDDQIKQAFSELNKLTNSEEEQEYISWISMVPTGRVHSSISSIKGVNLDDSVQRETIIYPTFKYNIATIDFWLNKVVYPKESKVFDHKIMCSPWDLCGSNPLKPLTGFSGTNDTRLLLPMHVNQMDLPGLIGTNGKVLANLLKEENNYYENLELGFSWKTFLIKLKSLGITMLLDVGALMIQANNEDLITEWLSILRDIGEVEAGVYFNSNNQLCVKDKQNRITPFETSPYRHNLGCCLIYLDEWHTRGTDLRIPSGTKGGVTIGRGVTKDKLVQGCMRMRMIGNGHTVSFFSSHEVHNEILHIIGADEKRIPGSKDVLTWALRNSINGIRDGFAHWVNAGINYMKKKIAKTVFDKYHSREYQRFGEQCSDLEITSLDDMYGTFRKESNYIKIVRHEIESLRLEMLKGYGHNINPGVVDTIKEIIDEVGNRILETCETYIPNMKKLSAGLDEEQIRELEPEKEEERQIDRNAKGTPYSSSISKDLLSSIATGQLQQNSTDIFKLPLALKKTSIWKYAQDGCWGDHIYVTKGYREVAYFGNQFLDLEDQFIRSPTWIVSFPSKSRNILLLLISPQEANAIFPLLKNNNPELEPKVILHMFSPQYHPFHEQLFENPKVAVPSSELVPSWLNPTNPIYQQLNSNLLFFSGSFYFSSTLERESYCNFLGCVPGPWTENEEKALQDGLITKTGFVIPANREKFPKLCSTFVDCPKELVELLVRTRYGHFPEKSHLYSIIFG